LPKAIEAFRNIGEVSAELGVRKHVLRFWESRFPQLKPMKRGGGRRYYRPTDVQLLRGIQHLLQTAGYTIKGVQKILREEGVEDVKRVGKEQEEEHAQQSPARAAAPLSEAEAPRKLSAAQVTALRAVVVELETVRAILAGTREADARAAQRPKRAARG
jgi:DNA-binding transcriptional MerR regulator